MSASFTAAGESRDEKPLIFFNSTAAEGSVSCG